MPCGNDGQMQWGCTMIDRRIQHNHTEVFFKSFDAKAKITNAIVLDSGCGDGFASKVFADCGASLVFAHDITILRDGEYDHPNIVWFDSLTDVYRQCDIVWSHHVIEHTENPIEYLRQLQQRLSNHGELWLTCPNTASNAVFAQGHLSNFTIANLVLCLQAAMFDVENICWLINDGQLRVRIRKTAIQTPLPEPFVKLINLDAHFGLNKLHKKWRWNEE